MPFNGSGTFTKVWDWERELANNERMFNARLNNEFAGIATGLSNTIARDGQSTTTAIIPLAFGVSLPLVEWTTSSGPASPTNGDVWYDGTDLKFRTGGSTRSILHTGSIGVSVQAWDADLDAIAAFSSTGFAVRTASNTWAQRTITGTASEIDVTNGSGVSGNPTISLPSAIELGTKTLTRGAYHKMRTVSIGQLEDDRAGGDTLAFISETISNAFGSGAGQQWHNFAVTNTVTRTGGASGNGFTDNTNFSGSGSYGHYVPYQYVLTYGSSGTISSITGFSPNLDVTNGTVSQYIPVDIRAPTLSGGAITSAFGMIVQDFAAVIPDAVAIRTNGTAPVQFGGQAQITGNAYYYYPYWLGDFAAVSTTTGRALTAAEFITGLVSRTGPTANFADTLPTASAIYDVTGGPGRAASVPGKRGVEWRYKNNTAYTATLNPGTGTSVSGGSTSDKVAPFETGVFIPIYQNNGSGSETILLLRVGSETVGSNPVLTMTGTGLVVNTSTSTPGTLIARTLTGTANEITVANGDGISGHPTVSLPSALTFTGKTVTGGAFTGGTINNTSVGATTASTGRFTSVTLTTGDVTFGADQTGLSLSDGGALYDFGGTGTFLEANNGHFRLTDEGASTLILQATSGGTFNFLSNAVYYATGTDVPVTDGGTGASTASGARTNLGLGTIATQDASNVSITGGSATGLSTATVVNNQDGLTTASVSNNSSGTSARADFWVSNDGTLNGGLALIAGGTGYTGITQWQDKGVLNAGTNLSGMIIRAATGSIILSTGAVTNSQVTITSGIQVGAPTGGDKGTGTINVATDIYKNNTAYTNPDYVFEREYTGGIARFADRNRAKDYRGRLSLDALRAYTRQNLRLPGITDEPAGMFDRGDIALEKIEELTLYVLDMHERLKRVEDWIN